MYVFDKCVSLFSQIVDKQVDIQILAIYLFIKKEILVHPFLGGRHNCCSIRHLFFDTTFDN